ncbi:CopG family transcriptional regulator [Clostridium sp. AF19-22AC]|jgi:predicted transcriptional regulator|uniref:CopG family transcriptional regulator n=1 Tax=Faecalicatena orotica TaxID=1544 RepID=A0A2Y9BIB0_9FIRM|nr:MULTISPECIES: CopG family transcriptional regulator [Clostridia]PWJ23791.1 hypothetical protein A8806_11236 [Faecalicatena orotica]RHR29812.1 CopG family transcriptional regulator [Clostridium sp. AF19-22AC]SSA57350.1 hypothetical protein SAMN05216536_11236 [Faecalicatena orotica]
MEEKKQPVKFRVARKPIYKEEKTVNMTLRIDKGLQQKYDLWAEKTNRSRNELMCMALAYAMENIEIIDEEDN